MWIIYEIFISFTFSIINFLGYCNYYSQVKTQNFPQLCPGNNCVDLAFRKEWYFGTLFAFRYALKFTAECLIFIASSLICRTNPQLPPHLVHLWIFAFLVQRLLKHSAVVCCLQFRLFSFHWTTIPLGFDARHHSYSTFVSKIRFGRLVPTAGDLSCYG